jgi:hypothetical protein
VQSRADSKNVVGKTRRFVFSILFGVGDKSDPRFNSQN